MTATTERRPATFDHLRSAKKPNIVRVQIALDPEVAEAHARAKGKRDLLKLRLEKLDVKEDETRDRLERELIQAEAELEQAEAELRDNAVTFVFKSIGRKKLDKLISLNPPTPDQRQALIDDGKDPSLLQFNADTFPPQLIALSCVEPEMTLEDAQFLWNEAEDWNGAELQAIYDAAMAANSQRRVVNLGNG